MIVCHWSFAMSGQGSIRFRLRRRRMGRLLIPAMLVAASLFGAGAQANPVKSLYTTIDLKECKQVKRHRDGNAWECPGLPGFPVYIAEGDLRQFVSVGTNP